MVCLFLSLFLGFVASLQACKEPINVNIQNYEGPIILHKAASNCDNQQLRNPGNCDNQCLGNGGNQCLGNCGNQCLGNCGNQYPDSCGNNKYKQNGCYETECTCVSKVNYAPYVYSGSSVTYGGSGCCSIVDSKPMVYCVCNSYGNNGYHNNYGVSQGYQAYPNYQGVSVYSC